MMDNQTPNPQNPNDPQRPINEQLEIAGSQLVDRVKELIEQGNVRRLIIRNPDDRILLEIPLTIGVVAGSALALFMPVWAALGAMAALVARVKVEVVREEPGALLEDAKEKVEDIKNDLTGGQM
jgi:DNA-binding Lrp family transcriptional regulator